MCADCISNTMAISTADVEALVHSLERLVVMKTGMGTCRACGKPTLVYWLYTKNGGDVPRGAD